MATFLHETIGPSRVEIRDFRPMDDEATPEDLE